MKQYKILFAFILLCCSVNANAQMLYKSVLANSGSNYTSAGLSADWTVGETVIKQYTSTGMVVTEGFHPIFIATEPTSVKNTNGYIQSVKAYPNPTNSMVNISIEMGKPTALSIEVLDIMGKAVMNSITLPAQTRINTAVDLSDMTAGTYIIKIRSGKDDAYVMKVIKE